MEVLIPLESVSVAAGSGEVGGQLRHIERALPPHLTPERPTTYTLELIAACNHQCVGCGNVFSRQMKFMPGAVWRRILHELRADIVSLRITGGECTLHPDFKAIIDTCDQLGIPFVVFTNGRWRRADEILALFAGCKNLDGLLISLHGHDPATYSAFVVTDSFDIVTRHIRQASAAGIRVGTNTILLRSNVEHIERIANLSFSLGAASAAFSRYYGAPLPGLELTQDELREAMARVAALRVHEPRIVFNNCVPMCFSDVDIPTKGCTSGFTHCTIDPLGNVRPCTHSPFMLGNLLDQDIMTIWDSTPLWQWRDLIPPACTSCGVFTRCRGGCRATAYHQGLTQDPLITAPLADPIDPPLETLSLYRHAHPVPHYTLRHDQFGVYLINRNRHIAVAKAALPILDALDGQTTLADLRLRFGQVALDFVGSLILSGVVQLVRPGA